VFGISADSPNAQKNFKTKQKLPYSLLSDTKYQLLGPLAAKKTATGGVIRSHWIFRDGKLAEAKNGVKPDASPAQSLELAK
jgi:peroxiredoxin Q/BCP